jgi:hypothetical protein
MDGIPRLGSIALMLVVGLGATACGSVIPADPEASLSHVTGGVLRVGYAPEPGLIVEADQDPTGPLATVVIGYARSIDADVEWTLGSEETLIDRGELDVAVGGFTESSPWTDLAALSRGFAPPGKPLEAKRSVALFPLGENALLSSFETYVDDEGLT